MDINTQPLKSTSQDIKNLDVSKPPSKSDELISIYSVSVKETLVTDNTITYQHKPILDHLLKTSSWGNLHRYAIEFINNYFRNNVTAYDNKESDPIAEIELTINHNKGFTIYKRFFCGSETLVITQGGFKSYFNMYR